MNPAFTKDERDAIVNGLWLFDCPYYPSNQHLPELQDCPDGVSVVIIALAGPDNAQGDHSAVTDAYMYSSGRTRAQLKEGIAALKARGIRVGVALFDNPDNQWPQVNIPVFVGRLKTYLEDMGLDPILDLDLESSTAKPEHFSALAAEIKKTIPGAITHCDTYPGLGFDQDALFSMKSFQENMDRAMTMTYSADYEGRLQVYSDLSKYGIPIAIGVKQGDTPYDEAIELASKKRPDGKERLIGIWNLKRCTAEFPYVTGIEKALKAPPQTPSSLGALGSALWRMMPSLGLTASSQPRPVSDGHRSDIEMHQTKNRVSEVAEPAKVGSEHLGEDKITAAAYKARRHSTTDREQQTQPQNKETSEATLDNGTYASRLKAGNR